ncbi:NAD(P)-dependent oxidoreductase [Marinoscillum furvescens]|uniref:Saccharopine dehydrogenase [NAD(+), L-lysine-forming] n=1 Tax=Marinoscillum furvescens DSM 4134 TaxID=1122208 RepID=A0A3D9LJA8_MARFU|nr:NAD(P)-dependent oxidoreductase [Marinoscillum furvescens]REE05893.1 alanine dehydrogenase [Marinoscillum furvescens DSM 4134]
MTAVKIALIKEGKVPIDRRVALTPFQARQVKQTFPNVEVVAQRSDIRCFSDADYEKEGIELVDDVSDCDILLGVKEVPIPELIDEKTYFFFSHTIKKQPYNQKLLRYILDQNIRLIDYETLTDESGKRIIAFGRWAGIVGAYNGVLTYGRRYNLFDLKPAHQCFDLEELKTEYTKVKLPANKIAVTGGGRVAKGAMEVLHGMGIRKVSPGEFLQKEYDGPVFTQLNTRDYHRHKVGSNFSRHEFYSTPENYESDFLKFAQAADLLVAAAFWDPKAPVLFTREDILRNDFKIKVIADITCDIEGSIPSTKKPSTIEDPIYDYNPSDDEVEAPFSDEGNITVMAVDNLPCELPRDASESFGNELVHNVLPELLGDDSKKVIERATITLKGQLTPKYEYLTDYAEGKL